MSALSTAGGAGANGLADSLLKLAAKNYSLMPGTTVPTQYAAGYYVVGVKIGMGLPINDADKRNLLLSIQGFELGGDSPMMRQQRAQSIGIPYMAFLATHDTVFASAARRC